MVGSLAGCAFGASWTSDGPRVDLEGQWGACGVVLGAAIDAAGGFNRARVRGSVGADTVDLAVLAAPKGLFDARSVSVEGTYGADDCTLVVTFDDAASEASVHGSVGRSAVHLGLRRPQVLRSILPGLQIGLPGGRIEVTGRYAGPPPLLALLVGTLLRFV